MSAVFWRLATWLWQSLAQPMEARYTPPQPWREWPSWNELDLARWDYDLDTRWLWVIGKWLNDHGYMHGADDTIPAYRPLGPQRTAQ